MNIEKKQTRYKMLMKQEQLLKIHLGQRDDWKMEIRNTDRKYNTAWLEREVEKNRDVWKYTIKKPPTTDAEYVW